MTFPNPLRLPIRNHLTGRPYELVRADAVVPNPSTLARITTICNEPKVYEWLFRKPLEGQSYTEAKAREWLARSYADWASGTHLVFIALDESGNVAAACAIKSDDPIAEIGYWASQEHRGVMTNTIKAMCALAAEAGYQRLFARTKIGNRASQAVLERAGFHRTTSSQDGYERFEVSLSATNRTDT